MTLQNELIEQIAEHTANLKDDDFNREDERAMQQYFQCALAEHQKNNTTHFWQSEFVNVDTAVRDTIAMHLQNMDAWAGWASN